jgi:hypothetical protein
MDDVTFSVGGAIVVPTSDTGANAAPWKDLGTQLGQTITYYGKTTSTTGGTSNKWTAAQLGSASCRQAGNNAGREHVFKFTLNTEAKVELRLAAVSTGTSAYNPVLSLFGPNGAAPVSASNVALPLGCARDRRRRHRQR